MDDFDIDEALANAADALEGIHTDDAAQAAWIESVRDQLLALQTFLDAQTE